MIEEAYVSFETAKLLKEKGFDEHCSHCYCNDWLSKDINLENIPINHYGIGALSNTSLTSYNGVHWEYISAPTQAMAMAWLRKRKNIDIFPWLINKDFEGNLTYSVSIYNHGCEMDIPRFYDENYENLIEEALKYTLKNMI